MLMISVLLHGCVDRSRAIGDAHMESETEAEEDVNPSLEIGNGNVNVDEAFVLIGKVATDRRGGVLILDRFATEIAWFTAEGRLIARIGRSGSGPGEFERPQTMMVDDEDRLHVYDAIRRRISIYQLADTAAVHLEDQQTRRPINDMCTIGGRRFATVTSEDGIIDEIDMHGNVVRTFGYSDAPATPNSVDDRIARSIRAFHELAMISCDARSETILLPHENVPIVRAFTVDGVPQWRSVLADYHGREVFPEGAGIRIRNTAPDGKPHGGVAIATLGNGQVLVSLWRGSAKDREGLVDGRILDLETGVELRRISPRNRLALFTGDKYYAIDQYPEPKVLRYDSGRPWSN